MYYLLSYDYVEGIVEKRVPFREGHLGLARSYVARGELLLAGAYVDPVDGATFVFKVDERSQVEAFVAADPYVANGLVSGWRIREWNVVEGALRHDP